MSSFARINRLRRQRRFQTVAALSLVVLGPALAFCTYWVLGPLDQGANSLSLRLVLLADLVYALLIAALVLGRVVSMVAARRARSAGSLLHLRLTGAFALLALIPTVLVAIFSVLIINVGLEGWFSERVRTVLGTSLAAAQAYGEEHRQDLTRDAANLASSLDEERQNDFFMDDGDVRQALGQLQEQSEANLTEAFVLDSAGTIRARGALSYEFDYEQPPAEAFEQARGGEMAIIEDYENNEFRALVQLPAFVDRYLYVTRAVDGGILSLLDDTQETVALYQQLEAERGRLLFEFGLLYLGFAVVLILAAIWLGLWFAERLSRPIGRLVAASQRVGAGNLDVHVIEDEGEDEIALLGRNFNHMTSELKAQREALLANTRQIEERRRLFDSVLHSITSGVIGLDPEGRITFANRSARRLLAVGEAQEEMALVHAVPEFSPLFEVLCSDLRADGRETVQDQVALIRGGSQESLLVRMSTRRTEDGALEGYVVAFDDITDLVGAQRMAAWGDVARRIAHEIKNPLTPIRLSAERISRKFRRVLSEEDAATLDQMTEVIVRQTGDLRRIVDEFSKFARMPEPDRITNDLTALVRSAGTLQEAGQPEVQFHFDLLQEAVQAELDATMIHQALTNLMKNAGEAIETLRENGAPEGFKPEIRVRMVKDGPQARITVSDNGIGLPEDRSRLFEPYVTTRDKGTGLGLPIVKKIIEEHGGTLSLADAEPFGPDGRFGAMAVVTLPVLRAAEAETSEAQAGRAALKATA
ncbi:sensor histidine kinase NtrY-like [Pseudoroseicyclus aestuarii]|uniref:sensor histidine kinase NtrY-like n=1 Tax=Pseudoroseicyclus aestuarii TaxID=1795041 RepID=UPI001FEA6389|nr:PAS domain-containing sensor histidine kinase [Pseudoroseicyclus aestuarii]